MARGRLGHALLFLGPRGVGRETCARGLAAGVLCERAGEPDALPFGCGACRSCARVRSGAHPDLHVVMNEADAVDRGLRQPDGKKKPSRAILVDQVRELSRTLRMKPYEGRARVAIVVDAHGLNLNAANALLKTLEEPSGSALLILTAPHARAVLPTITSRCQRVHFAPLKEAEVAEVLTSLGVADAERRARVAEGSVAQALELDVDEAEGNEQLAALLKARLFQGTASERLDAAEQVGRDRREADRVLDAMQRMLARELRKGVLTPEAPNERSTRELRKALDAIAATRTAIAENAHVQLALEELLLRADRR